MSLRALFTLFGLGIFALGFSQEVEVISDSTFIETTEDAQLFEEVSDLDPQRAAMLSAILPGMGQVYNKQYWKVPIIYGGLAVFGHFINYNNELYHTFRNASLSVENGLPNPFEGVASSNEILIRNRDNFRRNRDFLIILGSVFYLLNIVDAHVSAHLDEFEVNDDLAISIKPGLQQFSANGQALGASLVISF